MTTDPRNPWIVLTVRCAAPGCANIRGHANHWFVTSIEEGVFICRPYSPQFGLRDHHEPVCGQACAQKIFDRYLTTQGGRRA
jgi:hypothetical protein